MINTDVCHMCSSRLLDIVRDHPLMYLLMRVDFNSASMVYINKTLCRMEAGVSFKRRLYC